MFRFNTVYFKWCWLYFPISYSKVCHFRDLAIYRWYPSSILGAISPGGPSTTVSSSRDDCVVTSSFKWPNTKWRLNLDVTSAGLDSGVAISILVIFFALQFPKNGSVSIFFLSLKSSFSSTYVKIPSDRNKQHRSLVGVSNSNWFRKWQLLRTCCGPEIKSLSRERTALERPCVRLLLELRLGE